MSPVLPRSALTGTPLAVTPLTAGDRRELLRLVDADPIVNAALAARLQRVAGAAAGGALLGARNPAGHLVAAALHAGNLLPAGADADGLMALAYELAGAPRMCTSIVGRACVVADLWDVLAPAWGPARAIRQTQLLLVLDQAPARGSAQLPVPVRRMRLRDLDRYVPASAAMFEEELGASPYAGLPPREYRRRLAGQISQGRSFGIVDQHGAVIFKADISAVTPHTCQVQGVWVRPDHRRQGLGAAAIAAVLRHGLTLAPTVSLYVNDYNVAARRTYARLGMRELATLSTVLF